MGQEELQQTNHVQHDIAQQIGDVVAFLVHAAYIQRVDAEAGLMSLAEARIGDEELSAPVPDAARQQLHRPLQGQRAIAIVALEIRPQILIDAPQHRVKAGRVFQILANADQMHCLNGFVEAARPILGNPVAYFGDLQQLLFPGGIRLGLRHLPGQLA